MAPSKIIVHPCHEHPLQVVCFRKYPMDDHIWDEREDIRKCHGCLLLLQGETYGYCCRQGCEYGLHEKCATLIEHPQVHHPLHPQHPLNLHFDIIPNHKTKFQCSFCRKTKESDFYYHCSSCDFYLDIVCLTGFMSYPKLLSKYEICHSPHVQCEGVYFPLRRNHRLSPYIGKTNHYCHGCGLENTKDTPIFKCTACSFCLHVQCSQVPDETQHHHFHPQHKLILNLNHNPSGVELRCYGCRNRIRDSFFLQCSDSSACPDFILDLECFFLKPNMIPNRHHHPLVHFEHIYHNDVICLVCNTPCKEDSFRCVPCNYNIHPQCIPLPSIVDYDDHIHPLTLTPSFIAKDGHYYCDICETSRDPDHGVYLCKECSFVAHFLCALGNDNQFMFEASSSQNLEDGSNISQGEIKGREDNSDSVKSNMFGQLRREIEKLEKVVEGIIHNKRHGIQLTEKLKELDERRANTERILRQVKQNFSDY
ncbi:hypothetical protein FEM48_Zijuj10G0018000 [Ziziphus jujuba var. spinosa]|uniref:DC1 domain-containing protein n=1 Tax=Ziziphus jujuba var. spinosa TaxID=714518 RepID=A0A978UKK6_ZIZJJ|nr:hypothetical protein FEM48_Zijuj10G0018000 [Ziziphus jujuba var. spinosa]